MTSRFSSSPLFASLSDQEIETFVEAGDQCRVRAGERIFNKGEPGDCMYFILTGEVEIDFGEAQPAKRLFAGDVFGELAFLTPNHHRTAGAVAACDGLLCSFGPQAMETLSPAMPRALVSFLQQACAYLLESEQKLAGELKLRNRELEVTLDYLRRTSEDLSYQELLAHTDELTGLYNRRCLSSQLARFVERAQITGSGLALIAVDLDRLKSINDAHGHAGGDQALRHTGNVLRRSIRKNDLACRVGGDEFSLLLVDINDPKARIRAEGIRRAVALTRIPFAELELRVTVSLGGTLYESGEDPSTFLERGDRFLYRAKEAGRNRLCWEGEIHPPLPGAEVETGSPG